MSYIDDIIEAINDNAADILRQFKYKAYGIAEPLPYDSEETRPVHIDATGNAFCAIDDNYEVIIFHMGGNTDFSPSDNSFGDGSDDVTAVTNMTLYAFAQSSARVNCRGLRDLLLKCIPSSVTLTDQSKRGIYNNVIEVNASVTNAVDVFNQLYSGLPFMVRPEDSLVSVTYTVTSEINKSCFSSCTNC